MECDVIGGLITWLVASPFFLFIEKSFHVFIPNHSYSLSSWIRLFYHTLILAGFYDSPVRDHGQRSWSEITVRDHGQRSQSEIVRACVRACVRASPVRDHGQRSWSEITVRDHGQRSQSEIVCACVRACVRVSVSVSVSVSVCVCVCVCVCVVDGVNAMATI